MPFEVPLPPEDEEACESFSNDQNSGNKADMMKLIAERDKRRKDAEAFYKRVRTPLSESGIPFSTEGVNRGMYEKWRERRRQLMEKLESLESEEEIEKD